MYDRVQIIIIIIMLELIIALEIFVCRVSELMPSIFTFMQLDQASHIDLRRERRGGWRW